MKQDTRDNKGLSLLELFPAAMARHKLTEHNHFTFWPFLSTPFREPMRCKPGWRLVGWSYPPYSGGAETAMVVEAPEPIMDDCCPENVRYEAGLYWYHWSNDRKDFARPVVECPENVPLTKDARCAKVCHDKKRRNPSRP